MRCWVDRVLGQNLEKGEDAREGAELARDGEDEMEVSGCVGCGERSVLGRTIAAD